MRVAVMSAPGEVRVEDRPEPKILKPTDAIIRLSATCICGSDLWPYRATWRSTTPASRSHPPTPPTNPPRPSTGSTPSTCAACGPA